MNINGCVNYFKLNNSEYNIDIYVYEYEFLPYKCDSNEQNIDINHYLINIFKDIKYKTNFFSLKNQNEVTKINDYFEGVTEIQKYKDEFKNITFINYDLLIDELIKIEIIINNYNSFKEYNRKEIKNLIIDLDKIIHILNQLLNLKKEKLYNKLTKQNMIIMEYIYINYFLNKIKLLIVDINKIKLFCEKNLNNFSYLTEKNIYFDNLKNLYKNKYLLIEGLFYLNDFLQAYTILLNILTNKNKNNIIYCSIYINNLLLLLLINNFSFQINFKEYSDKIIDNNNIDSLNKLFKNVDILNPTTHIFLKDYLLNLTNCIKI
jgi:hypothetical protein